MVSDLVVVGTGMTLAGQISQIAKSHIESADVVFTHTPHELTHTWLCSLNHDVRNLQDLYAEGKHRMDTYEQMVDRMLSEVRLGKKVCGAFYGHPGVFACVPHMAVEQARKEGFSAKMEPGISAEACLYADLGIDPGNYGIQSFEASQFFFYDHQPNTAGYILLWQIGLVGEPTGRTFDVDSDTIHAFQDFLMQWYPPEHELTLYEAAVLPIETFRADKVAIKDLHKAQLNLITTAIIPPARKLENNRSVFDRLGLAVDQLFKR